MHVLHLRYVRPSTPREQPTPEPREEASQTRHRARGMGPTLSLTYPGSTLESASLPCALVTIWSLRLVSLEDHFPEWIADLSSVQTEE